MMMQLLRRAACFAAAFVVIFHSAAFAQPAGSALPGQLRCEYLTSPLGIDVRQPRLSWILNSPQRGQKQTAYQIVVASSAERLAQDQGDLWDSGKVASDDTTAIVYAGADARSHQRCWWKVRAWDNQDCPSPWSDVANWSFGLLDQKEWTSQWIGFDAFRNPVGQDPPLEGAQWVWFAGDKEPIPVATRVFAARLSLPADAKVKKAQLCMTADDRFVCNVNGKQVGERHGQDAWKSPRLIDLTEALTPGENRLAVQVQNETISPAGLLARLRVELEGGKEIVLVTNASWMATDQPGDNWHTRDIKAGDWPAVRVIGEYGIKPWGKLKTEEVFTPPPVHLRKNFAINKPVKSATLYASALGIFDAHLNGQRLAEEYFNPGWTDYKKRVYWRAYDVTARLKQGDNTLGAVLADGWFSGYVGYGHMRNHYGDAPRFRAQLHVEFADGTSADIATGPDWKASVGPTRIGDFLAGETFDARLAIPGWDTPGFDDASWKAVDAGAKLSPIMGWHPAPPVRVVEEFRAKKITQPQPGVYVLDLGRNFAGFCRLTLSGQPGQTIILRHAERLNPDGTIYTTNLRSARATDTYICKGSGPETWSPRYTFHGFQYVEITGLTQPPTPETVVGLALTSDTPVVGSFECSDPMLNQLHGNAFWTQRANFIDIPTDCPQRDERLGWMGDAQVYIRTATLNTDTQAFFTKWLLDVADGQRADGQFPMVAPVKVAGPDGGPAWADAGVICPWTVYAVYGDRRILERQYDSMKKFIAFCKNRSKPDLTPPDKFHCFGDWLSINAKTPNEVIYTAYFAYSTKLMAQTAEVLGKSHDAAEYNDLFLQIKAAFNKAYVAPDGRVKGDTQCGYVLAIAFDLVDGDKLDAAAKYLVADIEKREGHLSTGFIGTKDLMLALSKIHRTDVAYRLLHNDTFPSWGFSIKHGATSIWERWDGWTPEKGFQDPGMNSFAHYSFGAVYQWMAENIGGIRSDGIAYRKIEIAPELDTKITWAKVGYQSIRGQIRSDWKVDGGQLTLEVTIPTNTTARVRIPAAALEGVTESGKPLADALGVKVIGMEANRAVVELGGGVYQFAAKLP